MARNAFPVEVLTPEGQVFAGEVEMLSTRTEVGEIGVLANHAPLLAMLAPADLRLHLSETEVKHFAQGEGYVQVSRDGVLLLVEEALDPGSLDTADLEDRRRRAEEAEQEADEDSEERRRAQRDRRRWEAFLKIAGGSA